MSGWDQFEQSQQQKKAQRHTLTRWIFATFGLLIGLAVVGIPLWLHNRPEPIDLSTLQVEEPDTIGRRTIEQSRNPQVDPAVEASAEIFSESVLPADNEPANYDRLAANLANKSPALFPETDYASSRRGPLKIEYSVTGSGQNHTYTVGQATYGRTNVVGAASEWLVRPWWKPGWLPTTQDCGQSGTVAIGGHVSWGDRPGPFHDIGAMAQGDTIRCLSSAGVWHTYSVSEVVKIGYNNTNYYWSSTAGFGGKELTLFSCTPEVDGIIVVRAELLDS